VARDLRVGEESVRPMSCLGLTEGEVDLALRLRGEASGRVAVDRFPRRLIDTAQP
jgi:hypothetical protein